MSNTNMEELKVKHASIYSWKFLAVDGVTHETADMYAAAPELLEALRDAVYWIEEAGLLCPIKFKEAIAKAEGRA